MTDTLDTPGSNDRYIRYTLGTPGN